jgi:hypothetical protein
VRSDHDLGVIQRKLSMVDVGESDTSVLMISKSGRYSSINTWDALREKRNMDRLVVFNLVLSHNSKT